MIKIIGTRDLFDENVIRVFRILRVASLVTKNDDEEEWTQIYIRLNRVNAVLFAKSVSIIMGVVINDSAYILGWKDCFATKVFFLFLQYAESLRYYCIYATRHTKKSFWVHAGSVAPDKMYMDIG